MPNTVELVQKETFGLTSWYRDGVLHRDDDLPAKEYADGSVEYYQQGERHRGNGEPAVIYANGTVEYWEHGKPHRGNGLPAIACTATGRHHWFLHGNEYAENDGLILLCRAISETL